MQVWCLRSRYSGYTKKFWYDVETLKISVSLCRCIKIIWNYVETLNTSVNLCRSTKLIWNYIETAGLVSLHVIFRNLVAVIITSGETTCSYWELEVSHKLEHGPRHCNHLCLLQLPVSSSSFAHPLPPNKTISIDK